MGLPEVSRMISFGSSLRKLSSDRAVSLLLPAYSSVSAGSNATPPNEASRLSSTPSWASSLSSARCPSRVSRFRPSSSLRSETSELSASTRVRRLLSSLNSSSGAFRPPSASAEVRSLRERSRARSRRKRARGGSEERRRPHKSSCSTHLSHAPSASLPSLPSSSSPSFSSPSLSVATGGSGRGAPPAKSCAMVRGRVAA
mmetsp:Transcript_18109/g.46375  ORF Transcript_18109/g.46375 Transcript_18109/m.46375 type:complete len:200 (-) Transcript_18109:550-1149(-)